ncbi:putative lactoylglutathione lyase [Listeria fleischmannii 1991]|uniref:Predicted lactoylglutathione lyase n=2 Tax=Listeria fleischmannii TaxID=1069827 RepID=A0A2X3GQC0_9LIST|nr:VOC family protein [Listeria fleischmannii]EMG27157.1 glyoxalase [Listeria fleischmannii subsp. fleischmannii LU2006-1]KMT60281.1 putative lactoylglutathione lyase [Listeria fleischmannii 1991]SQC70382.1 Predicted lactoylglutathione lyase [Listeria fleischmannii subsp. fleischmannii]
MPEVKMTFINLPVRDLNESITFFTKMGFSFNPEYTDENATCMIINKTTFIMLLVEPFFNQFLTDTKVSDCKTTTSVITALLVDSKEEVDSLYGKALQAGGEEGNCLDGNGMYNKSFRDLNGHVFELVYMNN